MSFRGPKIIKVAGGLGQQDPSDRNVAGLVFHLGYEVGATLEYGTAYELNSIDDATALGLSPATDANAAGDTTALVWYHVDEFFRLNPDGKLWLCVGDGSTAVFAANGPADALMAASENGLRYIGVVLGLDPEAVVVNTTGFEASVLPLVAAAQAWRDARADANIYIDAIVVEGFAANATTIDLKALDAPQVTIAVATDAGYLADYDAAFLKTAAVGTALGSIGVRMLSESIGSVMLERYPSTARGAANYSLVSTRRNRWVKPGISTGSLVADLSQSAKDDLTAKGYLYVGQYEGYPGVYFNADATCTLVTDDYNTIHINRIWNEAARMVRRALIPRMNSRVRIDPDSGQIAPATIADWDAAAKRQLDTLLAEGEIADYTFVLDPAQDVIAQGKVITKLRIVPQGIAKEIEGEIGFTNPAQA